MQNEKNPQHRSVIVNGDQSSGGDSKGSTLVPMLFAGLFLVSIGGIVIMLFV